MIITGCFVNLLDDAQYGDSVLQTRCRRAREADILYKFRELHRPGIVGHRIFPDRGFRGPHFREHTIECKSLDSVTTSETGDMNFAQLTINLERKRIFPFSAAGV